MQSGQNSSSTNNREPSSSCDEQRSHTISPSTVCISRLPTGECEGSSVPRSHSLRNLVMAVKRMLILFLMDNLDLSALLTMSSIVRLALLRILL